MQNIKYIGNPRRVDDFGRVAIWKSIRQMLEIHEGDAYRVGVTEDGYVVIAKYTEEGGEGWKDVDIEQYLQN